MSLFDQLRKNPAEQQPVSAPAHFGPPNQSFTFPALPETFGAFQQLPEAQLLSPYQTAALVVPALCLFAAAPAEGEAVFRYLQGPRGFSPMDRQFLRDRLSGKAYVPFSYFFGATPDNNYTPTQPYRVEVLSNGVSFDQPGMARLLIASGGADSPRPVVLRFAEGRWYLWEQLLATDIRKPAREDIWR